MAVTGTSTGILTMTASNDMATGPFVMVSCRWTGGTTAGHMCRLQDLKGNDLFIGQANGADYTDGWAFDRKWVDGVSVGSMNSGVLQVYLSSR